MYARATAPARLTWLPLFALCALAALALFSMTATGQATQCDAAHGSGWTMERDYPICGQGSAAQDVIRLGAWTEGTNLVTSMELNVPFNQNTVPTAAQFPSGFFQTLVAIDFTSPTGGQGGTCFYTGGNTLWAGGGPDSYTNTLWRMDSCNTAAGSNTATFATLRWPSYKNPLSATDPKHYCNEIDILMPFAGLSTGPHAVGAGTPIYYGVVTGAYVNPTNYAGSYLYTGRTTNGGNYDTIGDTGSNGFAQFNSYVLESTTTSMKLRPNPVATFTGTASGTTVTLSWTLGPDSGVEVPYGYYIYEGGVLLTDTPIPAATLSQALTGVSVGSHTYQLTQANCRGESSAASATVVVTAPPGPPVCAPGTQSALPLASVTMTATGGDGTYTWSGGETPASGSGASFSTKYAAAGSYTITLTSGTQSTTCTITITTIAPPTCAPATQTVGLSVLATMTAGGGDGTYAWSGGESPATGAGGTFATAFAAAGTYSVVVTSGTATATCEVKATGGPICPAMVAKFSFSGSPIAAGEPVSFHDASSVSGATITHWAWDFGDGHTASLQSLSHTYYAPGDYKVVFSISDDDECGALVEETVHIDWPAGSSPMDSGDGAAAGTSAPTVFAGDDIEVTEESPVKLVAMASGGPGPFAYVWRQVSGAPVASTGADTSELSFTAPPAAGPSDPRILVFGVVASDGSSDSAEDIVHVTVLPKNRHVPVAAAGRDVTVSVGGTVVLDGSGSRDGDGDALTYAWSHAGGAPVASLVTDGAKAAVTVPADTTAPFIDLRLTVSDGTLESADTVRIWLDAAAPVPSGFEATVQPDGSVLFAANGQAGAYVWDFGDGVTLETQEPLVSHVYEAPGTYTVQLRLGADADAVSQDVTPNVPPRAYSAPPRTVDDGGLPWPTILLVVAGLAVAGLFVLALRHRTGKRAT